MPKQFNRASRIFFISDSGFENTAFWFFTLAAALTALGPIAHYTGWALAVIALIAGKMCCGTAIFKISTDQESAKTVALLLAFLIWISFAHVMHIYSFREWFKGATVYLEAVLCLLLAARLLDAPKKRRLFIKSVVFFNFIFCVYIIAAAVLKQPLVNRSLNNGNALGGYSILVMPLIFGLTLIDDRKKILRNAMFCALPLLIAGLSFSSGAWLSMVVQLFLFFAFYFYWKDFRTLFKPALVALCAVALFAVIACSFVNPLKQLAEREITQLSAANDLEKMTTRRYDVWRGTLEMIKERPVTGYGRGTFEKEYIARMHSFAKKFKFEVISGFNHPHSMYLSLLYSGGVPALLLFMLAFVVSAKRALCFSRRSTDKERMVWGLIFLMFFIGQLLYGTNGDIFESRRDIAVLFWSCWGLLLAFDSKETELVNG